MNETLFDPSELYQSFEDAIEARRKELLDAKLDEMESEGQDGWELPLCSWTENWRPSIYVANWQAWPKQIRDGLIIHTADSGRNTCMLRAAAITILDDKQWAKLIKDIDDLQHSYPLVDEGYLSEVEQEQQDKAWVETYRKEFQEAMTGKFEGVFLDMQHGDEKQIQFDEMVDDEHAIDKFFYSYMQNRWNGGEWHEHDDGSMSIDVDDIVSGIDTSDVSDYLWPEDPRQMKFGFTQQEAIDLVNTLLQDDYMFLLESPLANKIVDTLLTETGGVHSYSCLMINLPEELGQQLMAWGKLNVRDEDVYVDEDGKGREDEPHVTLKFGLLDSKPSEALLQVLENTAPFEIRLGRCSQFKNGKYDVLKLDVVSPFLYALNRNVCSVVAYEDEHENYSPHSTISYVKPTTCDRLEGASPWDDPIKMGVTKLGQEGVFTAKEVVFSSIDGTKTVYSLGKSK